MQLVISFIIFLHIWHVQAGINYQSATVQLSDWVAKTQTEEENVIECARGCNEMYEKDMSCNAVIFYDEPGNVLCTRGLYKAPPSNKTGLRIAWASGINVGLPAWFAIDRNLGTAGDYLDKNIFLGDKKDPLPWLALDLTSYEKVSKVGMVQADNPSAQKMKNVEIRVGYDKPPPGGSPGTPLTSNMLCALFAGPAIQATTTMQECTSPVIGRYVTLQLMEPVFGVNVNSPVWNEILIFSEPAEYDGDSVEILLRTDPVLGTCPSTHPYAYAGGTRCCSAEMEDLSTGDDWKTMGSRGLLHFDSQTCGSPKDIPCPGPAPCYNYQYQRYACYYKGVDIAGDLAAAGKEDTVEKCRQFAENTAGSTAFVYLPTNKGC